MLPSPGAARGTPRGSRSAPSSLGEGLFAESGDGASSEGGEAPGSPASAGLDAPASAGLDAPASAGSPPGPPLGRTKSKPEEVLSVGLTKIGLTDPKLQAGIIIVLLITGFVLLLTFVVPNLYNLMEKLLDEGEATFGEFAVVLIVGALAVLCANPVPGSHMTLLFIAFHWGVPVDPDDPHSGGACESQGAWFLSKRAVCFMHGTFFLYVVYCIAMVVNFMWLRNCCGTKANAYARRKGGDYVVAVDSVISAGGWQTFQAMLLLRMTPVPIGLQTLTLSVTSIGAPLYREAAPPGSSKRPLRVGWPYMGAGLLGMSPTCPRPLARGQRRPLAVLTRGNFADRQHQDGGVRLLARRQRQRARQAGARHRLGGGRRHRAGDHDDWAGRNHRHHPRGGRVVRLPPAPPPKPLPHVRLS